MSKILNRKAATVCVLVDRNGGDFRLCGLHPVDGQTEHTLVNCSLDLRDVSIFRQVPGPLKGAKTSFLTLALHLLC